MSSDPDLKQIISRSWQAGFRGTAVGPWGSIVTYNADAYLTNTSDEIAFLQSPYNPAGEGYFSNIGDVRRVGFDARLHADTLQWVFFASYSLIEATYESSFIEQSNNPDADANGNITVLPGDHLPGIPQNIVKFGVTYHATPRWTIGLTATAQTSAYLFGDDANLTAPLPGYAGLDLTTSYQVSAALQIFADIDNATNSTYYDYGGFSPTGRDGGVYLAPAPDYSNPRSYSIAAPIGVFTGLKLSF
jgi:outer membrane receptor protein involved in Fe transport